MTLRLDPAIPVVWRTPTSLQLGIDKPVLTFREVSTAEERMLAALRLGTTTSGLRMIGRTSGLTSAQMARFEKRIAPALDTGARHSGRPQSQAVVALTGRGPTVHHLVSLLGDAGLLTRSDGVSPDTASSDQAVPDADFAVVVAHFVVPPELFGSWLRRDTPHLPIVYGDKSVRIGPLIEPGVSPCLYCLERHHTDRDPAWPAMASQLLGRRSLAESALVASEVAARAARIISTRVRAVGGSSAHGGPGSEIARSVSINTRTGAVSTQRWNRHPECACHDLNARDPLSAERPAAERPAAMRPVA